MIAMKNPRLLAACLLILALSALPALAQRKKQIAVLDFDFATVDLGLADRAYGGRQNLARRVADKLITSLVGLGTCQIIERSQLEKVLNEQNLGAEGRLDASTAAKLGRILGVDALIIGNVSVFELKGLPNGNDDMFWDSKKMSARISVNFRVIDTTTAVVELSNEQTGLSSAPPKTSNGNKVGSAIGGWIKNSSSSGSKVKDEDVRDVVQQALDDTIGKITLDVEKYLSGVMRAAEPTISADKQVAGSIIEVNGPSLIVTGIGKGAVRMGDRLYVRRAKIRRDPNTNKEIRYSEKVGEVEVVEIQDEVLIGSFSGSGAAQVGDVVTNNPAGPSGALAATVPRTVSPAPAPTQPPLAPAPTQQPATQSASTPTTPTTHKPPAQTTASNQQASQQAVRQERSVEVQANLNWNDSGIDLPAGKQVVIAATGAINISPTRTVAPAGLLNRPAPASLPLPGANIGALLAKVCQPDGQCTPIRLIGAQSTFSPVKAGRLMLGTNDSDVADNSGAFKVTVRW